MRKLAHRLLLVYLCVLVGVMVHLPGPLGSVVRVVQYPALAAWAIGAFLLSGRIRRPHAFHVAFFGFILWNAASMAWTLDPHETRVHLLRYAVLFLVSLALWDTSAQEKRARAVAQAIVFGGYLLVGMAAYGYRTGAGQTLDVNRFGAAGMDPNDMAIVLAVLVPIAWGIAQDSASIVRGGRGRLSPVRLANCLFPLAALAGIVLSGSRGALLASVPGFIYVLSTLPRIPKMGRAVLAAAAVVVLALSSRLDLSYQMGRLGTAVTSAESGDMSGREYIWAAGHDVLRRNALIGVGSGAFPEAIRAYPKVPRHPVTGEPYVAHNTYLSVAAETGGVGLALFGTALLTVVGAVWRYGNRTERWSWMTAFAACAIGAASVTWDYRPYTWMFFVTALILVKRRPGATLSSEAQTPGSSKAQAPAIGAPSAAALPIAIG